MWINYQNHYLEKFHRVTTFFDQEKPNDFFFLVNGQDWKHADRLIDFL